jgi:hypothetical protein
MLPQLSYLSGFGFDETFGILQIIGMGSAPIPINLQRAWTENVESQALFLK